jgi:DNA-binding SARP family transcriptional activator
MERHTMINRQITQATSTAAHIDAPPILSLQPALAQLAQQLAEIQSNLLALTELALQTHAHAPAGVVIQPPAPSQSLLSQKQDESENVTPARFRIHCFGSFEVYDGDQLVPLQRAGKGNLILKFLAISRQPVLRDVLLETMYPELDPQVANNRLKVAIHHLRKSFARSVGDVEGAEIVSFRDGLYMLNPDLAIWTDVQEFERLWQKGRQLERAGRWQEAAQAYQDAEALYRGDLVEQDLLEEWSLVPRESLKDIYLTLLDKLATFYMRTHEVERAIDKWKTIIEKDAGREDAYRHLMTCYAERGQRAVALRWYEACVQALHDQLGVEPEAETIALYQRLRHQEAA